MTKPASDRRHVWTACAVALATAVGSTAAASVAQTRTIEQIERYCTASWRNAGISRQEWEDCTQQTLLELLDIVSEGGLAAAVDESGSDARRELNRAVWRLVQRCRRTNRLQSFDERRTIPAHSDRQKIDDDHGWEEVLAVAAETLSERQVQILELARQGWRVADIANRLGLAPERVSDDKYKATAKLQERLSS
jgi:hypothetical protein